MNKATPLIPLLTPTLLMLSAAAHASAQPVDSFNEKIRPILRAYCFECHGKPEKAKADLSLRRFEDGGAMRRELPLWKTVYDQVETRAMPPRDSDQPTPEERELLLRWLEQEFAKPSLDGQHDPGRPVLRRLTRLEYSNTIRDLFGLTQDVFMFPERLPISTQYLVGGGKMPERLEVKVREYGAKYPVLLPQAGLPSDGRAEHGYANRGDIMTLTPMLLERYVQLAGDIVASPRLLESPMFAALVRDPAAQPAVKPAVGAGENGTKIALRVDTASDLASNNNIKSVADDSAEQFYPFRQHLRVALEEGRGAVFSAEVKNVTVPAGAGIEMRFGPESRKSIVITPAADLWIASFATASSASGNALITNKSKAVKKLSLDLRVEKGSTGEAVTSLGAVVLSRRGQSGPVALTVHFTDGRSHTITQDIREGAGAGNTWFSFLAPARTGITRLEIDGSRFSGDYVLLDDLALTTAVLAETSAVATSAPAVPVVPGDATAEAPRDTARARLATFMPEAFRRPVSATELDRYVRTFEAALSEGLNFSDAMKRTVQAVLASPAFLYRLEPARGTAPVRRLTDHELASRLSYFLWASKPDAALMQAAEAGRLHDEAALEAEVRRMLGDPKARELIESFVVQWLRLDQLYTSKPDPRQFKAFYAGPQGKATAHASMLVEPLLLAATILVEDRSILEFIAADYTWLNPRLMDLYGLKSQYAELTSAAAPAAAAGDQANRELPKKQDLNNQYFRCALPDGTRGGVMTMGSTLTLSSLPTRTSPVKRGAWILETIFNRPPKEPKIAVSPLEQVKDEHKALTVRQKLELHRANPSCAVCHDLIDPPGFALESFDGIGVWRDRDGGAPVDSSGELSGGRSFRTPAEFKDAVLKQKQEFTRGFIEHMLAYALGRKLEWHDVPVVQQIQKRVEADGFRFSRVVIEIARSYPFQHVRNHIEGSAAGEAAARAAGPE